MRPARSVEDDSLRRPAKCRQRFATPRRGEHAYKSSRSLRGRNIAQLAQHARVVGLVVGIRVSLVRLLILQIRRSVARRVYPRSTVQSVNLQTRIVCDDNFPGSISAVCLRLLACIVLEGKTIFHDGGQGREVGNARYFNVVPQGRSSEIAQLARIGGRDQDSTHCFEVHEFNDNSLPEGDDGNFPNNAATNRTANSEIHAPSFRSHVRTKVICTRFAPASTGTSICPVLSRVPDSTARPFTSTRHRSEEHTSELQ